jgi:CRISPR type IV-associated protein Csf3
VTPLVVRATLSGAVMLPEHPIALDALLMAAYATRENLPPMSVRDGVEVGIPKSAVPLLRSGCGRIYLASEGQYEVDEHERRFLNRRFPIAEAQALGGPKMKRINMSAGATKGYRIPMQMTHLRGDAMVWYAIGEVACVHNLVSTVGYLGKKRSVGLGRVVSWAVEPIDPWEGFPVLLEGRPLRSLPLDWPGLGEHRIARRVLTPPYYERWRDEECAVA